MLSASYGLLNFLFQLLHSRYAFFLPNICPSYTPFSSASCHKRAPIHFCAGLVPEGWQKGKPFCFFLGHFCIPSSLAVSRNNNNEWTINTGPSEADICRYQQWIFNKKVFISDQKLVEDVQVQVLEILYFQRCFHSQWIHDLHFLPNYSFSFFFFFLIYFCLIHPACKISQRKTRALHSHST